MFVVVEFLTESLGPDKVNVYGPYESEEAAADRARRLFRATRAMKVVELRRR